MWAARHTPSMADSLKVIPAEDLKQHTSETSCWLLVNGKVYDVTEFLEEHPGGYDIILQSAGKDATQDFDEIGHSNSARDLLEKYIIGRVEGGQAAAPEKAVKPAVPVVQERSLLSRLILAVLPFLIVVIAIALYGKAAGK